MAFIPTRAAIRKWPKSSSRRSRGGSNCERPIQNSESGIWNCGGLLFQRGREGGSDRLVPATVHVIVEDVELVGGQQRRDVDRLHPSNELRMLLIVPGRLERANERP